MTDKEYRETIRRVERLRKKWQPILGLADWDITISFLRDSSADFVLQSAEASGISNESFTCRFSVDAHWQYLDALITANTPDLYYLDDWTLERAFVHELAHILVCETREHCEDWVKHEDHVATRLAYAFWRLGQLVERKATQKCKSAPTAAKKPMTQEQVSVEPAASVVAEGTREPIVNRLSERNWLC